MRSVPGEPGPGRGFRMGMVGAQFEGKKWIIDDEVNFAKLQFTGLFLLLCSNWTLYAQKILFIKTGECDHSG